MPAGAAASSSVKILKYVRTGDVINFDEEDIGEETMAMDVDTTNAIIEPLPQIPAHDDIVDPITAPVTEVQEESGAMVAPVVPQGTVLEGTPTGETPPPETDGVPIAAETLEAVSTQAEPQSTLSQQPLTQPSIHDSQEALDRAPQEPSSQLSEL